MFASRVVALYHEVKRPSRSRDMTPCDLGYLILQVFVTPFKRCARSTKSNSG